MRKSIWKQMAFMVVLGIFLSPGLIHAFGHGSTDDGLPPIPPFIAGQYDADKDGQLSADETEAAREAFMEQFDKDGDGELSRQERHALREAAHDAFIEKYDTDGDGDISVQEHEAARDDFIKRFDKDGDGELSKDELPQHGLRGKGNSACSGGHGGHGGPWR